MRVVVAVKPTPGGGANSQATRYIAYRDRDEEREGKEPRQLFSDREDALSFWKAERALTEGRTPVKKELLHLAVSFRAEDFEALGKDETARQQSLREVVREAIPSLADSLHAKQLRWVAGIHRNTNNPHIHLLIHREYADRDKSEIRTIEQLPKDTLPSRVLDEAEREQVLPGSLSLAFATALDRQQEKARAVEKVPSETRPLDSAARKEQVSSFDERLLEIARRNPSSAGQALTQEIILRGVAPTSDERPRVTDLRAALRVPNLDESDYHSPPEHANWLGTESQELRDLYERGATVKGDTLIIPAEEYELREEQEQPFLTSLSYALDKIENREQAQEFHTLARTIAGENADARTELEVFRHYYLQLRQGQGEDALPRMLGEMRRLAEEMEKLETRESVDAVAPMVSLEDRNAMRRGAGSDFNFAAEREPDIVPSGFNVAARKVNLREEALRFPAMLSDETKERLVTNTLPAIDRQLETGSSRNSLFKAIDITLWEREAPRSDDEREERIHTGHFLKEYVEERLKDPETRALNRSQAFRVAHQQINAVRSSEELSRVAETFLRENFVRAKASRAINPNADRTAPTELPPLTARERNLLFYGRAPEHHTPEMRELRYAWGLSREERAARVKDLHEGRQEPSPILSRMLTELDTRRTLPAVRHYQATLLNEKMENPGKLDLRPMYARLSPHERTYLIERIEEHKQLLTPNPERVMTENNLNREPAASRAFGAIPRESNAYREYMAGMGAIERELLNTALQQRRDLPVVIPKGEEHQLSITEARALLPREERDRIRHEARNRAWEQLVPPEALDSRNAPETQQLSDTIARLQEETQERARTAHQTLRAFEEDKTTGKSARELEPAVARQWEELNRYATTTREELYRGFETLDALRREYELNRWQEPDHVLNTEAVRNGDVEARTNVISEERAFANGALAVGQIVPPAERDGYEANRADLRAADVGRRAGYIDSAERWHFDSLRDIAEPRPYQDAPPAAEHQHDHGYEMER